MDDALLVRRFQAVGDLPRDGNRVVYWDRTAAETYCEVLAGHQFHHERDGRVGQPVDLRDIRMIERRERRGFALEPREPIGIAGEEVRQDLERDVALQPRIARAVDLAHAAGANRVQHFVGPDHGTTRQTHR